LRCSDSRMQEEGISVCSKILQAASSPKSKSVITGIVERINKATSCARARASSCEDFNLQFDFPELSEPLLGARCPIKSLRNFISRKYQREVSSPARNVRCEIEISLRLGKNRKRAANGN